MNFPHFKSPANVAWRICRLLLSALIIIFAAEVQASTYYVDADDGDDSVGVAPGASWKTLGHLRALWREGRFLPGDLIRLKGMFAETLDLDVGSAGTPGNPITIAGIGSPTIRVSDTATDKPAAIIVRGTSGLIIRDLRIDQSLSSGAAVFVRSHAASGTYSHDLTLENLVIEQSVRQFIKFHAEPGEPWANCYANIVIRACQMQNARTGDGEHQCVFILKARGVLIERNTLVNVSGDAMQIAASDQVVIRRNTIDGTSGEDCIDLKGTCNASVWSNNLFRAQGRGIVVHTGYDSSDLWSHDVSGVDIACNHIANNGRGGIAVRRQYDTLLGDSGPYWNVADVTIHGNVIATSGDDRDYNGINLETLDYEKRADAPPITDVLVMNNTIYGGSTRLIDATEGETMDNALIRLNGAQNCAFINNIFDIGDGRGALMVFQRIHADAGVAGHQWRNNLYNGPSAFFIVGGSGATVTTFDEWQEDVGETGAVYGRSPQFVSASPLAMNAFALSPSSPALGRGTDAVFDRRLGFGVQVVDAIDPLFRDIKTWFGGADIGAFAH